MQKTLVIILVGVLVILFVVAGARLGLERFWEGLTGEREVKVAEAEADKALANLEAERERTRQLQEKTNLTRAQNEGMIYKANAQAITRQSRAHVWLQGVVVVLLIGSLLFSGLMLTWLLAAEPRPKLRMPWRKDA